MAILLAILSVVGLWMAVMLSMALWSAILAGFPYQKGSVKAFLLNTFFLACVFRAAIYFGDGH